MLVLFYFFLKISVLTILKYVRYSEYANQYKHCRLYLQGIAEDDARCPKSAFRLNLSYWLSKHFIAKKNATDFTQLRFLFIKKTIFSRFLSAKPTQPFLFL